MSPKEQTDAVLLLVEAYNALKLRVAQNPNADDAELCKRIEAFTTLREPPAPESHGQRRR